MRNRFLRQFFCVLSMLMVLPTANYAGAALEPEQQAKDRLASNLTRIGMISTVAAGLKTFVPALNHAWQSYAQSHPATVCYSAPGILFLTGLGLSYDYQRMLNKANKPNPKESAPIINNAGVKYTALTTLSAYMLQRLVSHGIYASFADLQQFSAEHPMVKWCTLGASAAAFATWYILRAFDAIKLEFAIKPEEWSIENNKKIKVTGVQQESDRINVILIRFPSNGTIAHCKFGNSVPTISTLCNASNAVLSPDNQLVAYIVEPGLNGKVFVGKVGQKAQLLPEKHCLKVVFTNNSKNLITMHWGRQNDKLRLYTFDEDTESFNFAEKTILSGNYEYGDILIGPDNSINICYKKNGKKKLITYRIADGIIVSFDSPSIVKFEFNEQDVIVPCVINGKLNFATAAGIVRIAETGTTFNMLDAPFEKNSLAIDNNQLFGVVGKYVVSYLLDSDGMLKEQKIHGRIAENNHVIFQKAALCDNKYVVAYVIGTKIKIVAFSKERNHAK